MPELNRKVNVYANLIVLQALANSWQGLYSQCARTLEGAINAVANNDALCRDRQVHGIPFKDWLKVKENAHSDDPNGLFLAKIVMDGLEFLSFRLLTAKGNKELRDDVSHHMRTGLAAELGDPDVDFWKRWQETQNPIVRCHVEQIKKDEHVRLACDALFLANLPLQLGYAWYNATHMSPDNVHPGNIRDPNVIHDDLQWGPKNYGTRATPVYKPIGRGPDGPLYEQEPDGSSYMREPPKGDALGLALQYGSTVNLGLNLGIVGKAYQFYYDRIKLKGNDPYEELCGLEELCKTGLGELSRGKVVYTLAEATQRARSECKGDRWTAAQIEALRPSFELLADAMLNGRVGVPEAIYACGILFNGADPSASLADTKELCETSLLSIAEKKRDIVGRPHGAAAKPCTSCKEVRELPHHDAAALTSFQQLGASEVAVAH